MNLTLWPYIKTETGWSIPDELMRGIWTSMLVNERVQPTFYDGTVKNDREFFTYFQDGKNHAVLVCDEEDMSLVLLAWLNNVDDGTAYAHFCFLDKFSRDGMKKVLQYWKSFPLNIIVGVTPESYEILIKVIEKCGLTILGTIPSMCNMVYLGRREGGVISFYELGGQNDGKEIERSGYKSG